MGHPDPRREAIRCFWRSEPARTLLLLPTDQRQEIQEMVMPAAPRPVNWLIAPVGFKIYIRNFAEIGAVRLGTVLRWHVPHGQDLFSGAAIQIGGRRQRHPG